MVGSACLRLLRSKGFKNLVFKTSNELDLRIQAEVEDFISSEKPDVIIHAAAKVGGINANKNSPYEFLIDNMQIQNNLISSAFLNEIDSFIYLGSSCIYPKLCPQPINEEYLLSGYLEPTNEAYAIAKISGLKLIEALNNQYDKNYISLMPTNLYGPGDNFDLNSSHVLPALIRKFHEGKINKSKSVELWGTGKPMREFLHVDDLASVILLSIEEKLDGDLYNVGSGIEISIKDLANKIKNIVGYKGDILWNKNMPDGTPRKFLNSQKLKKYDWKPEFSLDEGIELTYKWFLNNSSL